MKKRTDERILSDGYLARGLYPLSVLYGAVVGLWDLSYRVGIKKSARLEKPVISVGNLVTGGSGKTGLTISLGDQLQASGKTVCILSRGYRGRRHGVIGPDADAIEWGDEAVLLKRRLPGAVVVTGKDRVKAGAHAIEECGADVILLDDGYQFRRLWRDLDLLLIDCTNPFGNGRLLPSGLLREPASSAWRANVLVLTHTDQSEETESLRSRLKELNSEALLVTARYRIVDIFEHTTGKSVDPACMAGEGVVVFSSIGNPRSFRRTVTDLGARIIAEKRFPDHHLLTEEELSELLSVAGSKPLATTEKDGVKLPDGFPCLIVRVEMLVEDGKDELERAVVSLFD